MIDKNYRVWAWEWMLWKKAVHDTIAFYKTNKLAVVGNLVGIAITLFAVFKLEGIEAMQNELTLLRASLWGIVGTTIFYVLTHRMSAPLVLYRSKEAEAHKFSWKDIEIKEFVFPRNSGFGIGLEVICDKYLGDEGYINIPERQTYIVRVSQGGKYILDSATFHIPLLGGANSVYGPFEYIRNRNGKTVGTSVDHTVFPIANWDDNQAWIVLSDGTSNSGIRIERNVVCRVLIIFSGEINRQQSLDFFQVYCDLEYFQDNNGHMKMKISRIERHVEYEV